MRKLLTGLIILGLTTQVFAQIQTEILTEVEIKGINYMYLNKMDDSKEIARPVRRLHHEVATMDVLANDDYYEVHGMYILKFSLPEGYILAEYDTEGILLKTTERFKDVRIPLWVAQEAIAQHPGSEIVGDVYTINYHHKKGINKKYKLHLKKDGKITRFEIDAIREAL